MIFHADGHITASFVTAVGDFLTLTGTLLHLLLPLWVIFHTDGHITACFVTTVDDISR
jgi:hypothetical protein